MSHNEWRCARKETAKFGSPKLNKKVHLHQRNTEWGLLTDA